MEAASLQVSSLVNELRYALYMDNSNTLVKVALQKEHLMAKKPMINCQRIIKSTSVYTIFYYYTMIAIYRPTMIANTFQVDFKLCVHHSL